MYICAYLQEIQNEIAEKSKCIAGCSINGELRLRIEHARERIFQLLKEFDTARDHTDVICDTIKKICVSGKTDVSSCILVWVSYFLKIIEDFIFSMYQLARSVIDIFLKDTPLIQVDMHALNKYHNSTIEEVVTTLEEALKLDSNKTKVSELLSKAKEILTLKKKGNLKVHTLIFIFITLMVFQFYFFSFLYI